jgi:hypothetical protein
MDIDDFSLLFPCDDVSEELVADLGASANSDTVHHPRKIAASLVCDVRCEPTCILFERDGIVTECPCVAVRLPGGADVSRQYPRHDPPSVRRHEGIAERALLIAETTATLESFVRDNVVIKGGIRFVRWSALLEDSASLPREFRDDDDLLGPLTSDEISALASCAESIRSGKSQSTGQRPSRRGPLGSVIATVDEFSATYEFLFKPSGGLESNV